jgi:predicted transcriptional regulator of viral defense system
MNIAQYIKKLLSVEEYSFSLDEIREQSEKTEVSLKRELDRLIRKEEITNLRKGFYLIITPRYSSSQKLPIQLYCDKLFKHLERNYYVAMFSAARFHGASHQQLQRDYVVTQKPKLNDIAKNNFDIRFFTASNWPEKNIQIKKSDAGIYKISSPALTIADLIHHQNKMGGINRILLTLEELAEELQKPDLLELLSWYPNKSTLQRFGFLLEIMDINKEFQELIFDTLRSSEIFPVLICPKYGEKPGAVDNRWKIDVNVKLEND